MAFPTASGVAAINSSRVWSTSFQSPEAPGTFPPWNFPVSTKTRLTKLPSTSASSLLTLDWKSCQVNSASFCSGMMDARTYRISSLRPGKSSMYCLAQTAQFREVEILSPSRFMNSFAGTLCGRR